MPRVALFLLLLAANGGCARAAAPVRYVDGVEVVRAADGSSMSWDELVGELLDARAIYVGERHDSVADHEAERAIAAALHARDPSLAIGLEMFDARAQDALDAYVAGAIDEATLLERSAYAERWGFEYGILRPTLEWARAHRVRVIALNVPREVTQAVARGALDALDGELRAWVPDDLVRDDAAHRAMVDEALEGHPGMSDDQRQRFYEAQLVWDEAMGRAVADALAREPELRRIVVFAGAFHVVRGLGIPRTAARRGAAPFRVVLPMPRSEADELLAEPAARRGTDLLLVRSD